MPISSTLPNALAIDWQIDMPYKHQQLQACAYTHRGACTKKFRQGADDRTKGVGFDYHNRMKNGKRWGGVCKALSLMWIAYHATDQDFWGWLFDQNGLAKLDTTAQICDLQGAIYNRDDHGNYMTRAESGLSKNEFVEWSLLKAGIGKAMFGHVPETAINGNAMSRGRQAAQLFAPNYKMGYASYRQVSFHGGSGAHGAHACAAWVAQDACYFDPNYGEYWFETVQDFRRWFELYFEITGYGKKYGSLNATCYAKKLV